MSAALIVLPAVWAFAETSTARRDVNPVLGKKGPHSLRLVRAEAEIDPALDVEEANPAQLVEEIKEAKAPEPRMAFYRKYTEAMLRRYQTMSMEAGRVPSLLGRELFRGNVSSYTVHSFEDVVIYVHDVERCMARLDAGQQHLVRRIALQGYTQGETSAMLGITLRTVVRKYAEALDRLTAMFLRKGLLRLMQECKQKGPAVLDEEEGAEEEAGEEDQELASAVSYLV